MSRWLVRRVMRPEEISYVAAHAEMSPTHYVMACGREVDVGYVEAPTAGAAIMVAYQQFKVPVAEMRIWSAKAEPVAEAKP